LPYSPELVKTQTKNSKNGNALAEAEGYAKDSLQPIVDSNKMQIFTKKSKTLTWSLPILKHVR